MGKHEKTIGKMTKELGSDKVKSDDFFRAAYSSEGMAAFRPGMPDAVVLPASERDVQAVVRIANEYKTPLIPSGSRISGWRMLEIPEGGAIVVDMTAHVNNLIEIDEKNLSVTAQGGASVYRVDKELRKRGFRLISHPVAQPALITVASDVAKCSIGVYGSGVGPFDRWCLGLKVVLGNGDILETGTSRILGASHFQRYHLPDLTGLFMGSEGCLGIITEVTQRIHPVPVSIKPVDIEFPATPEGEENLIKAVHEIRTKHLHFDMYWATPNNLSWFLRSEHYLNTMKPEEIDRKALISPYGDFAPDNFNHLLMVVVESIVSEEEAIAREKEVIEIGKKYNGVYRGSQMAGMMDAKEEFIYGSKTPYIRGELGQRINWLYWWNEYPVFGLPKAMRAMASTFFKTELSPSRFYETAYFTPYGGAVAAFVHHYLEDPQEVEEALKWHRICDETLLYNEELDTPVPTGVGAMGIRNWTLNRLKPHCAEYYKNIKDMFDPNHIMNPGKSVF